MWHYTKTKPLNKTHKKDNVKHCLNHAMQGIFRLNFTISMILISLFTLLILNKLNTIQQNIEEERIKADIQQIRLQIAENWISHNIGNKAVSVLALENSNPVLFLMEKPQNYIGEYNERPKDKVNVWFFNSKLKHFIYILENGDQVHYKLSKVQKNERNSKAIPMGGVDLIKAE